MRGALAVPFLRARLVAIFLLSLAAFYGVTFGFSPKQFQETYAIVWPPAALAIATLGGAAFMDRFTLLVDRAGRSRFQMLGWVAYGFILLLVGGGIMAGAKGEQAVRNGAGVMRLAQIAFLLLAGMGRGYLGAIANAFGLTCLAALAGGAAAVMSVAFYVGILVFFLVADYHARLFTDYPVDQAPESGSILGRAFLVSAALMAALLGFFTFVPCEPFAPFLAPKGKAPELSREQAWLLIRNLVGLMILAGFAFWLALRLGGGRGTEPSSSTAEKISARRRTEPVPPAAPPPDVPDPSGWRARIVKLYVRLAERFARLGVRRSATQTPREFSRSLAPAPAAESLTDLFMRARYSSLDIGESDFTAASSAGAEILDHLRRGK